MYVMILCQVPMCIQFIIMQVTAFRHGTRFTVNEEALNKTVHKESDVIEILAFEANDVKSTGISNSAIDECTTL